MKKMFLVENSIDKVITSQERQVKFDRLCVSAGDSSDEEDTIEEYDIAQKFQELRESTQQNNASESISSITVNSKLVLSFITHVAGIYSLYSQKVQKRYYELKNEKLKSEIQFISDEEIKKSINENCKDIEKGTAYRQKENLEPVFKIVKERMTVNILNDKFHYACQYLKGSVIIKDEFLKLRYFDHVSKILELYPVNTFYGNFTLPSVALFKSKNLQDDITQEVIFDLSKCNSDNFTVEFLAHLRLHNRSEKRYLKEFAGKFAGQEVYSMSNNDKACPDTKWKVFENIDPITLLNSNHFVDRWQDRKQIRSEKVKFGCQDSASYSDIFKYFVNTQDISTLLKKRVNIKKEDETDKENANITPNLLSLWYLLFGCEVIKNPAAIIHGNMVLDLAKKDESNLKSIYEEFPMAQSNSRIIQQAMTLNKEYSDFMPHKYSYQPKQDYSIKNLRNKEADVTKKWFEYKLGKSAADYLIAKSVDDNEAVKALYGTILESFEDWGLPLVSEISALGNAISVIEET